MIVLITGWVFLPVLQNGFVDGDDKTLINNLAYRGLGWSELRWMFAGFHFGTYQPLTWLTFGLDYVVWWTDPFGYHWTNLLLHAGNTTGVYLLALRLFSFRRSDTPQSGNEILRVAAGLSALVFCYSPSACGASGVGIRARRNNCDSVLSVQCFELSPGGPNGSTPSAPAGVVDLIGVRLLLVASLGNERDLSSRCLVGAGCLPSGAFFASGNWLSPEARRLYKEKIPYLLIALVGVVVTLLASDAESFVGETFSEPAMTEIALGHCRSGFPLMESVRTVRFVSHLRAAGMGSGLRRVRFPRS